VNLELTNPHSVLAALTERDGAVRSIRLPPGGAGPAWTQVADEARAQGVPVRKSSPAPEGRRKRGPKQGREGGAMGEVAERPSVPLDVLLAGASERDGGRGLWLALDCIQDPRNLGAAFRAAAFFGVAGVLLTRDRSAPITAVTYDAASGGLEHVPYTWASNLVGDLDVFKQAGVWVLGAAEQAKADVHTIARDRPWVLVVGNEETGLRRLTRERCDDLCRATNHGAITSLNAATATAVLLSALRRPG
jgi:23S rRNA (guanosine2251-2'-O)-methyltransferase